jgi:hypothetical protein
MFRQRQAGALSNGVSDLPRNMAILPLPAGRASLLSPETGRRGAATVAWPAPCPVAEPFLTYMSKMVRLSEHPIVAGQERGRRMIDLHYWTTPNGHKITIALEEMGTPYRIVPVNISAGEQFAASFLRVSPNNRIPAIIDHAPEDGGEPLAIFESERPPCRHSWPPAPRLVAAVSR